MSNPKDLERMQHEMESLERRITSLEDEELEVMARLEDAQRSLDAAHRPARRRRRAARQAGGGARRPLRRDRRRARRLAEQRGRRGGRGARRPDWRCTTGCAPSKNGVGAAALRARQCGGCS